MDEEKVDGGEDGEELEEEVEEETGTDEDADPRRSLQFSESLPLETFADWTAHDWVRWDKQRRHDGITSAKILTSTCVTNKY